MATATDDAPFRLHSLIGEAGAGSNGEKLVAALIHHYPPELRAAMLKRPNDGLMADNGFENGRWTDDAFFKKVSKIADTDVIDACIRGGELSKDDAVVTYAVDDGRDVVKGCFPYGDLGKGSSDGHVSQTGSLAQSPAARDHKHAEAKAAKAEADDREQTPADPYAALADASAGDLVKQMEEHPERIDAIKLFEEATRGDKARKTVMEFEPEADDKADSAEGSSATPLAK